jgi:4-amino-4-deoxy-L-arabinose transferase-like glycosyltransferase
LQHSTLAKRAPLPLFIIIIAVYFYGLGRAPFVGPDEPRYAQVAREMFERADLVTPTLGGHTWFEKPALLYWMMMGAYALFGVSEWSARLGPACSGLLCVLFVYLLGRLAERAAGPALRGLSLWSSLALASSAGLIVFSRAASFDIIVTMTITGALACFFASELEPDEHRKRWWLAGFYAGVGASLVAKGLIGIVIPFGTAGVYYLFRRERPGSTTLYSALWGLPAAIALSAIWYGPVIARHRWLFIDEFFIQHHFARYVSNKYRHPQPFYFYVPVMALFILPWTAFLAAALFRLRRLTWRAPDAASRLLVFAFAWLVVTIAFFSLSGSKLPGYVLPALPGAALLAGERLMRYARGETGGRAMRASGALLLLLGVVGITAAPRDAGISTACAVTVAAPLIIAGLIALGWARRRLVCALAVAGAMFAAVPLINICAIDKAARRESVRDLIWQANARGYQAAPLYQMHTIEHNADFYAAGRVALDARGEPIKLEGVNQMVDVARRHGGAVLILVPVEYVRQLTQSPALETTVIADNGAVAIAAVRRKDER